MKYYLELYSYDNVGSIISRLIRLAQFGQKYKNTTHSEIRFVPIDLNSDIKVFRLFEKIKCFNVEDFNKYGICFSSSIQDGNKTRFKHIKNNNGHFIPSMVEVSKEQYFYALEQAYINKDKPYGYIGILLYQILKLKKKITYGVFCSETVTNIFKSIGILDIDIKSHLVNPAELRELFNNK